MGVFDRAMGVNLSLDPYRGVAQTVPPNLDSTQGAALLQICIVIVSENTEMTELNPKNKIQYHKHFGHLQSKH